MRENTSPEYQKARNIIKLVIIITNDGNVNMKKIRVVEVDPAIFQAYKALWFTT